MTKLIRPQGFDYSKPDDETVRCRSCNDDGMNRTGLKPYSLIGSLTTAAYASRCPQNCYYGLRKEMEAANEKSSTVGKEVDP